MPLIEPSRSARRPRMASWLAVVVVALLSIVVASPAQAHTDLTSSTPGNGARLSEAPRLVTLTFNEGVSVKLATVSLEVDGRSVGRLVVEQGAARGVVTARVPLVGLGQTRPSRWNLGYRVSSVDGHPIAGTISFEVAAAPVVTPSSEPLPTEPEKTTPQTDEAEAEIAAEEGGATVPWVAAMVFVLVGLGALGARRLGRSSKEESSAGVGE